MTLFVPVSVGEMIDKITILQIKAEKITNPAKLKNVISELAKLLPLLEKPEYQSQTVADLIVELRDVNQTLWVIEDNIRQKEADNSFDADFIELARSVYQKNDLRAEIKKRINLATGSELQEEKSYKDY